MLGGLTPSPLPSHSRLPVARSAHGATVYSDKLWIFAGYDGNARWVVVRPLHPTSDCTETRRRPSWHLRA